MLQSFLQDYGYLALFIGTFFEGAVFGAIAFVALQEFYQSQAIFGSFAKHWQLPLGLTIIAFVALMPKGLIGLGAQLRSRKAV